MFATVTIPIESKEDSSYEKACQQFMQSYYTEDKVILDLKEKQMKVVGEKKVEIFLD